MATSTKLADIDGSILGVSNSFLIALYLSKTNLQILIELNFLKTLMEEMIYHLIDYIISSLPFYIILNKQLN